jgi:PAS domain S-box-containing protein
MNRSDSAQFLFTLILISLAGLTALVIATGYVLTRQKAATDRLNEAIDLHDTSCRLADQLRQSSDDLTRMVRTYAVTGDSTCEEHFYTILAIRDGKVARPEDYDRVFWDFKVAGEEMPSSQDGKRVSLRALMEDAGFADEEFELLAEAQRRSDRLVELEEVAMNAIKGKFKDEEGTFTKTGPPDRELALQILFGEEYHQAKSEIMRPINDFLIASDARTAGALAKAQKERGSLSLALVCLLCCLLFVSPFVAFSGYGYHRASHAELKRSEERFRATFEQAAVGIAHVSPDGEFLRINDRFCEIVGYARDEMLALTFQGITHPDDLAADVEHVQRLLRGEADTYSMKKRYYRRDGDTVWVNLTVSLIREDTGKPRWFVAVAQDITELERAQESLREREARLQGLLNATPETIALIDRDGTILSINENGARRFGTTTDALTGRNMYQVLPADVMQRRKANIDQVFGTGKAVRFEDERGSTRFANSIYPVLTPEGDEVASVAVFAEDVTAERQAEEALKESRSRFRRLVEQSPLAIEILTPEGQVSQVNASWMRLWNFNEQETAEVLENYNMLADKQAEGHGVASLIRKAFAGEAVVLPPIEYVVNRTLDNIGLEHIRGRSPWIQCHLFPIRNPSGEITNVVSTYVDITEQKQAERDLNAYQERLRALALELTMTEERERRRIATELHDGAAQSLAYARIQLASACKAVAEDEAEKKLDEVSQILRESLGQIREVLLDLSSPSMNEIGLGAAISERLTQHIGRRYGLKTSFADECGKVPLDDDVRAVLFRNTRELLANVVKHAGAKSVSIRIETTGEVLRITVEDDGAGFQPDKERLLTESGGFGLFSIQECMVDLGGELEVVSVPGSGCKATLVMPLGSGEKRSRG